MVTVRRPPVVERSSAMLARVAGWADYLSQAVVRWSLVTALLHLVRYLTLAFYADRVIPLWWEVATTTFLLVFGFYTCVLAIVTALSLTAWLVNRRRNLKLASGHAGCAAPRPSWQLWAGCLVPVVNLFAPPVFLQELAADSPEADPGARRVIIRWWMAWLCSAVISALALWRALSGGPQAAADAVAMTALACVIAAWVAQESRAVMWCFADTSRRFTRRFIARGIVVDEVP